ncbi:unnamed protein product [Caenorhabditis nigoni]
MTTSNVKKQLKEAEQRDRELQGELEQWRSGAIKLACNCDPVNAREEFPTPNIPECKDLSERLVRVVAQLKKPLLSACNSYRVQLAHSRQVEWKQLSKEEERVWTARFDEVRTAQVDQCRAEVIAYEPSENQKRKMKISDV